MNFGNTYKDLPGTLFIIWSIHQVVLGNEFDFVNKPCNRIFITITFGTVCLNEESNDCWCFEIRSCKNKDSCWNNPTTIS